MSWRQLWQQFRKNRAAELSLYLIIGFVLAAALAHQFSPYDPFALGDETLIAPRGDHWMGTDDLGRDTLSRVIHGTRVPLLVGFLATAASMALGILIGSLSGYFGGRTDVVLMRATEYVLVVPRFFLALLVVAMLGTGIMKIVLVIGFLGWPEVARVVRAQFLSFREREFVLAARAIGASHAKVIFREILPNAIPPAVVVASLLIEAHERIGASVWLAIFPGLAISLLVLCVNLFGDGINDVLNPKLRKNSNQVFRRHGISQ